MNDEGDAKWACPQCTFLNPDYSPICEICDITRTDADPTIQVYTSHEGQPGQPQAELEAYNETTTAPVVLEAAGGTCVVQDADQLDPVLIAEAREQPADVMPLAIEDLELQSYCESIPFPSPPQNEEQGLENLAEHLASAYTGKSYVELMQECPKAVEKLYHRYFAVVCPQKNLSFGTAIRAWDALSIGTVFKSYGEWKEFLLKEQKLKGSISKDGWQMLWSFAECEDRLMNDYSADEAWPSIIDSFVEWKYEKEGRTFKSESVFASDPSAYDQRWSSNDYSSARTTGFSPSTLLPSAAGASSSSTTSLFSTNFSWSSDYRGLYNQGATCYMNSLLQTLFMTPEFRRSLYLWRGGKGLTKDEEDDSIPLQLQRLFARLQFSEGSSAISTQALTQSFGWDSGQSFVQQDAQELCRVLFDVIEEHFAGTSEEHVIQELYQGRMKDYVQCTVCGYESSRSDKFLDVSLDIHNVSNLTEALDKFVTPEILSGSSRWRCSKCDALVDARKGLKIVELPYILMVQLKRFDYNYDLDRRVKLNHLVEFPHQLSLDKYVDDSFEPEAITHPDTPARGKTVSGKVSGTKVMGEKTIQERRQALLDSITRLKESLREGAPNELCADHYRSEIKRHQETLKQLEEQENKEKEEVAKSRAAESEVEEETAKGKEAAKDSDDGFMKLSSNKKRKGGSDSETMGGIDEKKGRPSVDESDDTAGGQHAYELYSVLVHSGSATGGHYYAYIKSFERNKWYEFNDSYVTEVSEDKIKQAYGSDDTKSLMDTSWGCSAYMLCYRRVDPNRNMSSVLAEEVDEELRNIKEAQSTTAPWSFNFEEKDNRKSWYRDSSDEEADNERGNTSDDMEVGTEGWDTEWDIGLDDENTSTTTTSTATEVIVATKEVITEEEDLELAIYFKHSADTTQSSDGNDDLASSFLEKKTVPMSSNATVSHLLKKARTAFDLSSGVEESALELSDYDPATQQVKPTTTLWYSNQDSDRSMVLLIYEVLLASDEGSSAECEFCAPKKVFVRKRDTLLDLKHAIHKALGGHMTPDKQRVILAASCWTTKDLCESPDSTQLSTLYLFDKDKIYVEHCEDLAAPSPALKKLRGSDFFPTIPTFPSSSTSSSSTFPSSSSSSWRPKEKGIQIRRRGDRPSAQPAAEESQGHQQSVDVADDDPQPPLL